jgi:hypothetical protein
MTYDIGDPGLVLGQAQHCGGVKPVNEIVILCEIWCKLRKSLIIL